MKIKSLFRRSVITLSYIMVFLSSSYFMYAQCPTVNNPNPIICDASGFTFNDLNAFATDNGDGILWYSAATGGSAFTSTQLVQEGTYYAESNSGSCAPRPSIMVDFVVNPSGQIFDGFYCSNENPTIQTFINNDIQPFISGGLSVAIFYDPDLTILANATDALSSSPTNYYIVLVDGGGCESQVEVGFAVVFDSPTDPTPVTPQEFCSDTNPTVADLDTGTTNNFNWFASVDGLGNPIPPALNPATALSDGENYFIRAYEGTCTSSTIEVTVNIFDPANAGTPGTIEYCDDNVPTADFDLFPALVGMPDATGTWTGPSPITANPQGTTNISGFGAGIYIYTYTVPANGACPEDIATVTITISETFTSGIPSTLNPVTFCEAALPVAFDLSTLLDNEDPNGQWTQGTTSTDPVVTSPIDLSGFTPATYNFTYTQNVSPNLCPEESTTVQVVVLQDPNAGIAVNAVFCENELTTNSPYDLFNALDGSQDNNSGTWTDISSNTVASPIDITAYTVAGSPYLYTYTIDNGTCSDSEQITITIEPAPESGTINGTIEFCEGAAPVSYNLFDLLDNEDQTGTWYIGADNTGTAIANPVDLSAYTAATYDFTFDVDAIGICDDELVTVQVVINPLPNTGIPNNPAPYCENDPVLNNTAFDLFTLLGPPVDAGGTWTDDNATGALSGNSLDLSQLVIGTFNFTYGITDANGCSNSTTVTIVIDDAPESGTVNGTTEFCEGAAPVTFNLFDLLDNEDQTGTWYIGTDNTGTAIANPVDLSGYTAATYDFTFDVDAIGICDDELVTVQVTINPLPNTGTATPRLFCENDLAANSPFDLFGQLAGNDAGGTWTDDDATGALTGNSVDLTLLAIGSYNFTYNITDANMCSNSSTVVLTVEDAPSGGTVNASPEFCLSEITTGQTINLFDFLDNEDQPGIWNDDTPSGQLAGSVVTLDGLAAGTYSFTYDVDAIGTCDDPNTPTVTVIINDTPAPAGAAAQAFCDAATIADLSATGTTIQWYDEAIGGTALLATTALGDGETYYATQTDATTGCESATRLEVTVTINQTPNAGALAAMPIIACNNTTVNLNTGLDGSQDATGTWMDDDGTGAVTGNTFDTNGIVPGTYNFTYLVIAAAPCLDDSTTITVTVEAPLSAGTANGDLSFCSTDATYNLFDNITGVDIGGTWSFNSNTVSNSFDPSAENVSGTYTYFIANACGNDSVSFDVNVSQAADAGTDGTFIICIVNIDASNSALNVLSVLNGTPNTSGTFTNDDAAVGFSGTTLDLTQVTAGTYNFTYTVTAVAPCTMDATAVATVTVNDSASATVNNATPQFCASENPTVADLEASVSGTAILWYAEPTTTTPLDTTEALINGEDYYATQTDTATSCESSIRVSVTVTVGNAPTPTLIEADQELCINDAPTIAELTDNISEYNATTSNVLWYDAVTNGSVISSSTELTPDTTYYAVLIDPVTGCESSIRLAVNPDVTRCGILVVPDGFSPNGDGVNDTFYVDNLDILYPKFEMEIYNRYGNIVYKGNASTPAFDGKSNQSRSIGSGDLPVGVYYYIFNFNDGVNKPEQGRLYLNR
ncbi:gliding motility-associated C-terminal domain-containing protein [Lacinutrix sp. Hel_I_90]|uniref:gliding motility-associated C-terminal domain-containing protein n=1 Tax=Lacinutrix sp. Hel_I_90 TaxID=1249999 RepID=UPI0018CD6F06|nr:gliding motility-associated C-terminal domain-containing protein [Lacinutrix sp. Hel_I_90]